jgi:hypothetical protein
MTHFTIEESNGLCIVGIERGSHLKLCKSKVLSQRKDRHETLVEQNFS